MTKKISHKLISVKEAGTRIEPDDVRHYYCDPDIDFIVTTITKPMISELHRHRENIESYYVIQGKLIMHIEESTVSLEPGDMAVIYPGKCHKFETTNEKVVFCAIKKFPLLDDKELC